MPLKWYSSMKKNGMIQIIFDILRWRSAIYHSIKLSSNVEVAEQFLNGI